MIVTGNRLTLLENGAQYFPALCSALDAATQEIQLESYLFEIDAVGLAVIDSLVRAAGRGVRVRMLLDGFGARSFPGGVADKLRQAEVELRFYRPERGLLRLRRHRLRRMHRKLVVVDGRMAFVGGINVIADDNAPGHPPHRYDYAVRIEGPLAREVRIAMQHVWRLVVWSQSGRRPRSMVSLPAPDPVGGQAAELVLRDNLRHRRDIEEHYLDAIRGARQEIIIANAYFLPGWRFRRALVDAAQRGVRVVLLLQGRIEYRLQHYASQALYRFFLENGVEIHEYRRSFHHAKVAVVDREWATVGSSNIDPFSLVLAREANLVVHDRDFAAALRVSLYAALHEGAHQVHRMPWRKVPWSARFATWASYGVVRALTGLVGYLREFDGDQPLRRD